MFDSKILVFLVSEGGSVDPEVYLTSTPCFGLFCKGVAHDVATLKHLAS